MKVTVTAGTPPCNHLTVRDATTGALIYQTTLAELRTELRDADALLVQMRQVVKAAAANTVAKAKTAIETADFI